MKQARRHHFVPVSHLSRFTMAGTRSGILFVFDKEKLATWSSPPEDCGLQRDLYLLELQDGGWTDAFEKVLAEVEGRLMPTVAMVIAEGRWPSTTQTRADLLRFVALAYFRTPTMLAQLTAFLNDQMTRRCFETVSTGEFARNFEQRHGRRPDAEDEQAFLRSVVDGDVRLVLGPNLWVEMLTKAVNEVGPKLAFRRWDMLIAAPGAPDFICSDCPAVLTLRKPELFPPKTNPGVSTSHTWMVLPLSRRVAMIGSHENNHPRGASNPRQVGFINRMIVEHAGRFVYSPTAEIAWTHGRHVLGTTELKAWLRTGNPWE